MSGIYGKGARGKATQLHSQVVRARGRCERCGAVGVPFDCAHIIARCYAATRTDDTAAWCLCKACHMYTTEHPWAHMELVEQTIGLDRFWELKHRAIDAGFKPKDTFWRAECDRLAALLKEAA